MTKREEQEQTEELSGYDCPQCGYPMVVEGDVDVCYKCGWWQERKE